MSKNKYIKKALQGIDFTGIKTTKDRHYSPEYISYIGDQFLKKGYDSDMINILLGNIIEESGGDPLALDKTGKYRGLLQWTDSRYHYTGETDPYKELDNLIAYIDSTLHNLKDQKSWTYGGNRSGYKSNIEAYNAFMNPNLPVRERHRAFSFGYVRPRDGEDSVDNRWAVIDQIIGRFNPTKFGKYLNTLPTNQRDTTGFNARRYWELNGEPSNFEEARDKGMFVWDDSDNGWHASSMAHNFNTGVDEIMKSPNHPTYWMNEVGTLLNKDYVMNHRKQNNAWYPYPYIPATYTRPLEQNLGPTYIK